MSEIDELKRQVAYLTDELNKEKAARHEYDEHRRERDARGPTPSEAAWDAYRQAKAEGKPDDEARSLFLREKINRTGELRTEQERADRELLEEVRKTKDPSREEYRRQTGAS